MVRNHIANMHEIWIGVMGGLGWVYKAVIMNGLFSPVEQATCSGSLCKLLCIHPTVLMI